GGYLLCVLLSAYSRILKPFFPPSHIRPKPDFETVRTSCSYPAGEKWHKLGIIGRRDGNMRCTQLRNCFDLAVYYRVKLFITLFPPCEISGVFHRIYRANRENRPGNVYLPVFAGCKY